MKRFLLVTICVLLLFITACSDNAGNPKLPLPTDNTYHPEIDYPYYMNQRASGCSVAQTENGYYFLLDSMLLYADNNAMTPVPVCAKPNCLHHKSDTKETTSQCTAYFHKNTASKVFYYDGQVYVFHQWYQHNSVFDPSTFNLYQLTRISPDGTQRQTILNIEHEWPVHAIIHRGYFYLVTQITNELGQSQAQLWAYSLQEPSADPQLLYESDERDFTHNIVEGLNAYGNYLYLPEYLTGTTSGSLTRSLRILNLTTREVIVPEAPEGYTLINAVILGGRLVCNYTPEGVSNELAADGTKPNLDAPMIISNLDGSNPEQIAFDDWGRTTADETLICVQDPICANYETNITTVMTDNLRFYDTQMNLLDELPLEKCSYDGKLIIFTVLPTRGEKILLHAWQGGKMNALYYINRSEIGTGNITPKVIESYEFDRYTL